MVDLASELAHARMYTMRELNQDTARVMKEINEANEPAVITRHGRFIALMFPLVHANVESRVLAAVVDAVEYRSQLTGETTASGIHDAQTVADDLDLTVNLSQHNNRELGTPPAYGQPAVIRSVGRTFHVSLDGLSPSQRATIHRAAELGEFAEEDELRRAIAAMRRENESGSST